MNSLLLLAACLLLGILVARLGNPPAGLSHGLNWWVLNVAFAALVLHLVPTIQFDRSLWFLLAAMYGVFLGAWALFAALGRMLHWSRARVGALTLVCGLGNTSFIGFPLIEALRGEEALKLALIADQLGCFVALSVGGAIVAALYSGSELKPGAIVRKVVSFPPFVSLFAGVLVAEFGGWPAPIDEMLARIGATLIPIALFSVGLQFRFRLERNQLPALLLGLSWKLVLAPLVVLAAGYALGVSALVLVVAVLESAMAPMISATILATEHDLEPALANTILGIGIVISFATVPALNALLSL